MTTKPRPTCAAPRCTRTGTVSLTAIFRGFGVLPGANDGPDHRRLCRQHTREFARYLRSEVPVQPELLPTFTDMRPAQDEGSR